MKRVLPTSLVLAFVLASCENSTNDGVVSQTYVHKYGFETTPEEWEEREQDGQVVSLLKNGVKVTASYEAGKLHGPTTYTFPHSSIVEKQMVYDQGTLLKETLNDANGMPVKETLYEFDHRNHVTLWDEKGCPLSVEEYQHDRLTEGKYYTPAHELEASVAAGNGERVKRDRSGTLLSTEEIANGSIVSRTTYHPNGNKHTVSHYKNYQLHGEQLKFTASGAPLMELTWDHGVLNGTKTSYRNGSKVAVVPYVDGQKHGTEYHYDDLGNLTAEIEWSHDKKHGTTQLHSEEATETEWFFEGKSVSAERFKTLENQELYLDYLENQAR